MVFTQEFLCFLQAIDDKESIREQCEKLGDHFISTRVSVPNYNILLIYLHFIYLRSPQD